MPQFTDFLQEQQETIQEVQEIENAIKLSNSVSQAFDFPRITHKTLEESPEYHISKGLNKSVYELICKQELVKKELLESKKNFEDVWATNAKIRNLATLVFENSDEEVMETLVEAIIEVPFLALTTKKQLFESISNAFSLGDSIAISEKEIKTFVARLFEMKKPVKQVIINLLNEKYGINVQNLKDTATFSSLSETQVVIFESLARLAPKGSIIKDTLSDLSKMLKNKNGVEVIDVNDVLQECFETCGYDKFCEDFRLVENISFDSILEQEVDVVELIEKAKEKLLMDKAKRQAAEDGLSSEQAKAKKKAEAAENADTGDEDLEDDSVRAAESSDLAVQTGDADDGDMDDPKQVKKKKKLTPAQKELDADGDGDIEGDDLKDLRKGKKKVKEETEEPEESESEEEGDKNDSVSKEDFLNGLKDMEELLQGMSAETEKEEVDDAETDETEA
tara:strand:- start:181 stop:1530 length:1350 start_codon:yes stop_codon:yes gene_type:complete